MSIHPIAKIILILVSGFLLSLSAPGYDLWFLAWIGLSPLFIIINTSKHVKETVFYSFIFGFAYNFWYLHWLFSLHPLEWLGFGNISSLLISFFALIIVTTYNSLFFALFGAVAAYHKKISPSPYNKGIPNFLLTTIFWLVIFNKLSSSKLLLGFPWTLIEYSQYKNLFLIQMSEYFGSLSISFLIVFFNQVVANFFIWMFNIQKIAERYVPKEPGQLELIIKGFLFILILICIFLINGVFLYEKNQQLFTNKSQTVCILQGNLPIKTTRGIKLDKDYTKKVYDNLIQKSAAEILIIPEGAIPVLFQQDTGIQRWIKNTCKNKNADLVLGTYCENGKKFTNCAATYSYLNDHFSYYEKQRLVPFGEFTPFYSLLPGFLKRFAISSIGEGYIEGKENAPVEISGGKAGVNICFELIFPTIIRKYTIKKANLLINLSDLSWFSSDCLKQQFIGFAVFRAIENRKPVIIAANNGISAFIEPNGKIKSQSLPNTRGVLIDWVNLNNKSTFYAKYGW